MKSQIVITVLALMLILPSSMTADDFSPLREAMVAAAVAHIHTNPPKNKFTLVMGSTYQFENGTKVKDKMRNAILKKMGKHSDLFVGLDEFLEKTPFPKLKENPAAPVVFYYIGDVIYIDDDTVKVNLGYSWARLKMNHTIYTVKRKEGQWTVSQSETRF